MGRIFSDVLAVRSWGDAARKSSSGFDAALA
jgi:hypothetical protein